MNTKGYNNTNRETARESKWRERERERARENKLVLKNVYFLLKVYDNLLLLLKHFKTNEVYF